MRNTRKYAGALTASALVLSMSMPLVGCGGNSAQPAAEEAKQEEVAEEAKVEETGEATAELAGGSVFDAAAMQEIANMTQNIYLGVGDNTDMVIYYAETDDTSRAALIGLNLNTNEYFSYIGTCESPEKDFVVITDDATGKVVNYRVLKDNDHYSTVDLGGDIGEIWNISCDIMEVVNAANTINEKGVAANVTVGLEA